MPNHAAFTGGFVSAGAIGKEKWNLAPAAVAVGPGPSALRFDARLTDCQAHATALRHRRKERVELVGLAQGSSGPVSFTEMSIWPSSPSCDFTVTMPPAPAIARFHLALSSWHLLNFPDHVAFLASGLADLRSPIVHPLGHAYNALLS